jgi:hypothetical protein
MGGGYWLALSDERIKTVHGEYASGLDKILQLRPVVYVYKGNDRMGEDQFSMHKAAADEGREFIGLVAQEVEQLFPEMVSKKKGWIDDVKVDDLRSMDASPLVFALVNAVKELAREVAALKARENSHGR